MSSLTEADYERSFIHSRPRPKTNPPKQRIKESVMSDYEDGNIKIRVLDYLEEFTKAIFDSLTEGEKKYGNAWLSPAKAHGVSFHSAHEIKTIFERFVVNDEPMDWASVAGYAMIAWIRENHPELSDDTD